MRTEVEFDDVSDGVGGVDRVASLTNPVFEDEDGGTIGSVDDHVPTASTTGLIMKALLTFLVVPLGLWFNIHAFMDITLTGHWDLFGETTVHYIVLVLLPFLSHLGCLYIIISFWMDEESHTVMRTRTMWATVPLGMFFTCQMMGQSTTMNWLDCSAEAFVQQICYLQANLWQTATVFTAYRFIIHGKSRLQGAKGAMVHVTCWGLPVLLITVQTFVSPDAFHVDLFESELRGIGWCGVDSTHRITKAIFVNTPQMICVSFYAQFYFYIHQKVDSDVVISLETTAKLSTSRNAKILSLEQARTELYIQDTARQLRLQMSAYMLSFLTNTVVSLVTDNLTNPDTGASDMNLLVQTGVVTCQGLLMAVVYASDANKPLLTAYWDTAQDLIAMCSQQKAISLATKREKLREKRALRVQNSRRQRLTKPTIFAIIADIALMFYQTVLLYPVAIWVWVPMDFISQNTTDKRWIFMCLIIWSVASVFPVYAFSLIGYRTSQMSQEGMENMAQIFAVLLIFVSAIAVYVNRYKHDLLMIERPCRYKGSLQRWFGPGQAFRFRSLRNVMGIFTLTIEFYQTWGLTWSATRMDDLYRGEYDATHLASSASSGNGEDLPKCTVPTGHSCEMFQFWSVVAMVAGWVLLYSFPAVVTTSTVGNRQFAHNMQEMYRKYLWFMSGAGFLTVLKACMQILFCAPNVRDPMGPQVSLTDHSIVCMSERHLQMIAISLLCLAFFFPSATLTALFRYDEDDDRPFPPVVQKGCVLGGEDIRWIHLWRRVEYLVKGVWVFSGMLFSRYGNLACVVLLLGSLIIASANYFMNPSNLRFVNRQKLNIHLCNAWTTLTCLWAATVYNPNPQLHFILMIAGWVVIWLVLWGYEAHLVSLNPFRKEIGDVKNQERCTQLIKHNRNYIMQASGLYRWGSHAKIVEITNLCEHNDLAIAHQAFQAMCDLAFCDQLSHRYSFFLNLTSTSPTINIMIDAIESSPSSDIKNFATRVLNSFLQTNTANEYGQKTSFHETMQLYDDAKGGTIAAAISTYSMSTEDTTHKIDAVQLALEMCQSDSNDIPAITSVILPMLNEWMLTGNLLQQYFATEIIMYCANRFDCTKHICEDMGFDGLIALFQQVSDSYGRFASDGANDQPENVLSILDFGYCKGSDNMTPKSLKCLRRLLPKKFKRLAELKCPGDPTTGKDGDEMLGVSPEVVLSTAHIRVMQRDILGFIANALADCAFAATGPEKHQMLQSNVLGVVISQCLNFDKKVEGLPQTWLSQSDTVDNETAAELQVEACRIIQFLVSEGLGLEDIRRDDDMLSVLRQLQHFVEHDDMQDVELHVFDNLSPLQRRKAHLVSEFMGLRHISDGPPRARNVLVYKELNMPNPTFELSPRVQTKSSLRESQRRSSPVSGENRRVSTFRSYDDNGDNCREDQFDGQDCNWALDNVNQVAKFGVVNMLAELCSRVRTGGHVVYAIYEIVLVLLEGGGLRHDDSSMVTVRQVLMNGIGSSSRGISVLACTGAHILLQEAGTYVRYGDRAQNFSGKTLFRKVAKMVFWMIAWKTRARRGRKAADFSDIALERGGAA